MKKINRMNLLLVISLLVSGAAVYISQMPSLFIMHQPKAPKCLKEKERLS